jgi:hypothetical protein
MKLALDESQAWSVPVGHEGLEIHVNAGTVLVTREGDPEDHVLVAPGVFTSHAHGRLAVWALTPAELLIHAGAHEVAAAA